MARHHEHLLRGNWYRFRACESIVPSKQQVKSTYRSCLLKPSRVHVVPNGIDAELFRPRSPAGVRASLSLGDEPVFVTVGRLSREKGIHHAVRALAHMNGDSTASLVVVGEGEERESLEDLVRQLGLAGRVTFAGAQPHETVALYLSAADAFLFPTERDEPRRSSFRRPRRLPVRWSRRE